MVHLLLEAMSDAIEEISSKDVSFADIRRESQSGNTIIVVNGNLREFKNVSKAGAVARVLVGECWGQASTTLPLSKELYEELLEEALKRARASAKYSRKNIDLSNIPSHVDKVFQKVKEDPTTVPYEEKIGIALELDKGQKIDDRVVNTNAYLMDQKRDYALVNTVGSRLEWDEIRTLSYIMSVAKEGEQTQFNVEIAGGSGGYEIIRKINPEEFSKSCASGAVELLKADKPPSGELTVILDGSMSGLIAHEVCGHASEADEVVKERSFLTGLVGKQIGTDIVTMVDDGTLKQWGGIPFDSEGTPTSRTAIIENGILQGYMHTLETSVMMGVSPTGNGRAQDYNRRIFARMTNTFFDKGDWKDEEIIEDTKDGLYVIKMTSGMEDVVGGGVQASALKGYIIKNGERTKLVRSMTLAGKVLEILKTVDAVGNTLEFDGGTCGKGEEDFIPVSSGGPHLRAKIVVGGG